MNYYFDQEPMNMGHMLIWSWAPVLINIRADMCLNCSLSVKSMKFGMMIVFKALKKIGYGAIAKKSVKCEK